MTAFIIVAGVSFLINIIFIVISLIYTYMYYDKNATPFDPTLSVAQLMLQHKEQRASLPQVAVYHTLVRLSTGSGPVASDIPNGMRQKYMSETEDPQKIN